MLTGARATESNLSYRRAMLFPIRPRRTFRIGPWFMDRLEIADIFITRSMVIKVFYNGIIVAMK